MDSLVSRFFLSLHLPHRTVVSQIPQHKQAVLFFASAKKVNPNYRVKGNKDQSQKSFKQQKGFSDKNERNEKAGERRGREETREKRRGRSKERAKDKTGDQFKGKPKNNFRDNSRERRGQKGSKGTVQRGKWSTEPKRTFKRSKETFKRSRESFQGSGTDTLQKGKWPKELNALKGASASETTREGRRVSALLARAGWGSRRAADLAIAEGRVTVNGEVIPVGTVLSDPSRVRLAVDGKLVTHAPPPQLWRYHKQRGVEISRNPQQCVGLWEVLPAELRHCVTVGRLDVESEGLLLLTSDGNLAQRLAHPRHHWPRHYHVRVFGPLSAAKVAALRAGKVYVDGKAAPPMGVTVVTQTRHNARLQLTLREGQSRVIRSTMAQLHLRVAKLMRMSFGPISLGSLAPGRAEEVPLHKFPDLLRVASPGWTSVELSDDPLKESEDPVGDGSGRSRREPKDVDKTRNPLKRSRDPSKRSERARKDANKPRDAQKPSDDQSDAPEPNLRDALEF